MSETITHIRLSMRVETTGREGKGKHIRRGALFNAEWEMVGHIAAHVEQRE